MSEDIRIVKKCIIHLFTNIQYRSFECSKVIHPSIRVVFFNINDHIYLEMLCREAREREERERDAKTKYQSEIDQK